ncbi:MAG: outer membrane protein assembly factor [Bacteroidaceae bacterium]|nr:outer membrane protein assembly factor [Bacteroidaceae bacterium]
MRKSALTALSLCLLAFPLRAQQEIKTGMGLYPLPEVAFDADKGLQLGGLLTMYNFGDGHSYPNYVSDGYVELAWFTKGSQLFQAGYDVVELLPGVRMSASVYESKDRAMDFFGFNGYATKYDQQRVALGQNGGMDYGPNYKLSRLNVLGKVDLRGNITDRFKWELGLHYSFFDIDPIDFDNINKGKPDASKYTESYTLYQDFIDWGIISEQEAGGGSFLSFRAGLCYDSRDTESAPTKGIWAEAHIEAAPSIVASQGFYRYSMTWRQYFRILDRNRLSLALRANYQGCIGDDMPFYALPYMTVMGSGADKDGMGGYRTVRGIMRSRVVGRDMAEYNFEVRSRVWGRSMFGQNIAIGLSAFSDGAMVIRGRDMSYRPATLAGVASYARYQQTVESICTKDRPHVAVGAGFRLIVNDNFILAAEYGVPVSHFVSSSNPIYNQDGTGAFYINTEYLF